MTSKLGRSPAKPKIWSRISGVFNPAIPATPASTASQTRPSRRRHNHSFHSTSSSPPVSPLFDGSPAFLGTPFSEAEVSDGVSDGVSEDFRQFSELSHPIGSIQPQKRLLSGACVLCDEPLSLCATAEPLVVLACRHAVHSDCLKVFVACDKLRRGEVRLAALMPCCATCGTKMEFADEAAEETLLSEILLESATVAQPQIVSVLPRKAPLPFSLSAPHFGSQISLSSFGPALPAFPTSPTSPTSPGCSPVAPLRPRRHKSQDRLTVFGDMWRILPNPEISITGEQNATAVSGKARVSCLVDVAFPSLVTGNVAVQLPSHNFIAGGAAEAATAVVAAVLEGSGATIAAGDSVRIFQWFRVLLGEEWKECLCVLTEEKLMFVEEIGNGNGSGSGVRKSGAYILESRDNDTDSFRTVDIISDFEWPNSRQFGSSDGSFGVSSRSDCATFRLVREFAVSDIAGVSATPEGLSVSLRSLSTPLLRLRNEFSASEPVWRLLLDDLTASAAPQSLITSANAFADIFGFGKPLEFREYHNYSSDYAVKSSVNVVVIVPLDATISGRNKHKRIRDATRCLIEQLGPKDTLGFVVYGSERPASYVGMLGRDWPEWRDWLEEYVVPSHGSGSGSGIGKALQLAAQLLISGPPDALQTVIVMSDEPQINADSEIMPEATSETIPWSQSIASGIAELGTRDATIYTIGVGERHNSANLSKLAAAGKQPGQYVFAEDWYECVLLLPSIVASAQNCAFRGVHVVFNVAQGAQLTVRSSEGENCFSSATDSTTIDIPIGDIRGGTRCRFVVNATINTSELSTNSNGFATVFTPKVEFSTPKSHATAPLTIPGELFCVSFSESDVAENSEVRAASVLIDFSVGQMFDATVAQQSATEPWLLPALATQSAGYIVARIELLAASALQRLLADGTAVAAYASLLQGLVRELEGKDGEDREISEMVAEEAEGAEGAEGAEKTSEHKNVGNSVSDNILLARAYKTELSALQSLAELQNPQVQLMIQHKARELLGIIRRGDCAWARNCEPGSLEEFHQRRHSELDVCKQLITGFLRTEGQ